MNQFRAAVTGLALALPAYPDALPAPKHALDVSYYAVVKNAVRMQGADGGITQLGWSFLAYVFLQPGSEAKQALLRFPGHAAPIPFPDFRTRPDDERDSMFFVSSDSVMPDRATYNATYPNGTYTVTFTTRAGETQGQVTLQGDRYPDAAVIQLVQEEHVVRPDALLPGKDLHVTWGGFPQGREDANGILDDLVFVILKDCHGKKLYHSGRPFQGRHLVFRDKSEFIPGQLLEPGHDYLVVVDNAILVDTNRSAGVPGVGTYAQTTRLPARVTGPPEGSGCGN